MLKMLTLIIKYFFPADLTDRDIITKGEIMWQNRRTGFYASLNYIRRTLPCFALFIITMFIIYSIVIIKILKLSDFDTASYFFGGFKVAIYCVLGLCCFILLLSINPTIWYYYVSSARADALNKSVDNAVNLLAKNLKKNVDK